MELSSSSPAGFIVTNSTDSEIASTVPACCHSERQGVELKILEEETPTPSNTDQQPSPTKRRKTDKFEKKSKLPKQKGRPDLTEVDDVKDAIYVFENVFVTDR
ncbi:hypothetical protein BC938DRAFT_475777 [Jimgerdemannia flammicorona]|uniref:Uncharacterized protein n=1 Tax=Jimgerdemannia flammicorona TaxID=994334 RepID=A0A433QR98_9FUNG|nr:hypothetical protein BC938DRAFT_475777 [Jimgerdemannia flammicorona]